MIDKVYYKCGFRNMLLQPSRRVAVGHRFTLGALYLLTNLGLYYVTRGWFYQWGNHVATPPYSTIKENEMKAIEPPLCNVIMGKDQEEYFDLPAFVDNVKCVTCWELSKADMDTIRRTGKVYLAQYNQGQKLQPVSMGVLVSDVYEANEIDAFETYATVEWDRGMDHEALAITACPICGALPNERCHSQLVNGDPTCDFLYKRVHAKRLR
jgi:hypothetical protein